MENLMNDLARCRHGWGLVLILAVTLGLPTARVLGQKEEKKSNLVARCDRDNATYKVGDKATFYFTSAVAGEAAYLLSNDGVGTIREGKVTCEPGKSYSLSGTLTIPGF